MTCPSPPQLAVLAVLAVGAVGRPQYQSGYGTGPLSEAKLWQRAVNSDQEDYRAARAAASLAIRLFRNAGQQTNSIKVCSCSAVYREIGRQSTMHKHIGCI